MHFCISEKEKFITKFLDARSYINYDKNTFAQYLRNQDWLDFFNSNDVNQSWNIMLQNISTQVDKLCPVKKIKIKDKETQDPWITHEIIEMIHDKMRLHKKSL